MEITLRVATIAAEPAVRANDLALPFLHPLAAALADVNPFCGARRAAGGLIGLGSVGHGTRLNRAPSVRQFENAPFENAPCPVAEAVHYRRGQRVVGPRVPYRGLRADGD